MIFFDDRLLSEATNDEFWLMMHTAKRMREDGCSVWPTNKTLMKDTGFGRQKYFNVKNSCISKGFFRSEPRFTHTKRQTSNKYIFDTERIWFSTNLKGIGGIQGEGDENHTPSENHQGGGVPKSSPLKGVPKSSPLEQERNNKEPDLSKVEKLKKAREAIKSAGGEEGVRVIKDSSRVRKAVMSTLRQKPGVKKISQMIPDGLEISSEELIEVFAEEWVNADRNIYSGANGKISERGKKAVRNYFEKWIGEDGQGVKRKVIIRSGAKNSTFDPDVFLMKFDKPEMASVVWGDWIQYKKDKRQGYKSDLEFKIAIESLLELSGGKWRVARQMVNKSMLAGYPAFYEPKSDKKSEEKDYLRIEEIDGVKYPIYRHDDERLRDIPRPTRPGYKWEFNSSSGFYVERKVK